MRLQVFQHVPYEGAGAIADWAVARGFDVGVTHWYEAEPIVPQVREVDFLVVMGGPMSVHDTAEHPWLVAEKTFLRDYITTGKPLIGVCLGGQLLAQVLGGAVTKNTVEEIGWFPVEVTPAARTLWPTLPASLTPLHWHGETFSLPQGATLLFTNSTCTNQAFLARNNLLGLQCHIEATAASTQAFIDSCPQKEIPNPNHSPFVTNAAAVLEGVLLHTSSVHAALHTLLDSLADSIPANAA